MGLNYSLCCVFERQSSKGILRALAPLLALDSAVRLANLDWAPATEARRRLAIGVDGTDARGIAGLRQSEGASNNCLVLALAVDLEPELTGELFDASREDGLIVFGDLWLSVCAGDEYVLLSLTCCCSALSRALLKSEAIARAWRAYAQESRALLAYIDTEGESPKALLPEQSYLYLPDQQTLEFEGDEQFSVDHFVTAILSNY